MEQKLYKTVNFAGIGSLVIGIVMSVVAAICAAAGVISIINGAKLNKEKKNIIF